MVVGTVLGIAVAANIETVKAPLGVVEHFEVERIVDRMAAAMLLGIVAALQIAVEIAAILDMATQAAHKVAPTPVMAPAAPEHEIGASYHQRQSLLSR